MALDPFEDSRQRTNRSERQNGLDVAVVVGTSPENHMVAIREVTSTGDPITGSDPTNAAVVVDEKGDVNLPREGDLVVIARFKSRVPIVLGTYYTQQNQIRDASAQERHIGSEDGEGVFLHGPFGVVPKLSESVTGAPDGAVWYRSDLDEYRGMENGTKVRFDTTAV
jgi:hypothetical protein